MLTPSLLMEGPCQVTPIEPAGRLNKDIIVDGLLSVSSYNVLFNKTKSAIAYIYIELTNQNNFMFITTLFRSLLSAD